MTIRYRNGRRVEAVVLAAGRERMRVATDAQRDTIELQRVDRGWQTEAGDAIEIEALIQLAGIEVSDFCAAVYPLRNTAGNAVGPA